MWCGCNRANSPASSASKANFEIQPAAGVTQSHLDYFGNQMTFVTVEGSHRRLVITSRSLVEVEPSTPPKPEETPAWETVRDLCLAEEAESGVEAARIHLSLAAHQTPAGVRRIRPALLRRRNGRCWKPCWT